MSSGASLGYSLTPSVNLYRTYGEIVWNGDGSPAAMIRLQVAHAF